MNPPSVLEKSLQFFGGRKETIRLLDEPGLIQSEIDRRMEVARNADPLRKREQALRNQQTRLQNQMDRMATAYQEELITLSELRQRMPNLRKQQNAVESELRSLELASSTNDVSNLVQCILWTLPRPEPVGTLQKILLVDRIEQVGRRLLHDLVLQRRNRDLPSPSVLLRDVDPAQRLLPVLPLRLG